MDKHNNRDEIDKHSKRVSIIAAAIGKTLGLDDWLIEKIKLAAKYHDAGKRSLPTAILDKPGKLTPEEYEIIKTHVIISRNILKKNEKDNIYMPDCCKYVLYHHENWDGTGYLKLKGDEIPKIARIIRIADVFTALTEQRCYKAALSVKEVIKIMDAEKHLYDPVIYPIFRDIILNNQNISTRAISNL